MKIKCYGIYENEKELVSEYANISQKNFLSFEVAAVLKKGKNASRVQNERTSNGVWYYKFAQKTKHTHIVLMATEGSSLPTASTLISKCIQFDEANLPFDKMKMKIAEQIRTINANAKIDSINSNVMGLENIMKDNVSKIIGNMGDLEDVEKKSERLNSLSMQLEHDSRALEEKMKRKACIRKLVLAGIGGLVVVFLIYYFFL